MRSIAAIFWIGVLVLLVTGVAAWLAMVIVVGATGILAFPNLAASGDQAWAFLFFCAVLGALTMILVQISRVLLPIRGRYHRAMLLRWFEQSWDRDLAARWRPGLRHLAADGPQDALAAFEQPVFAPFAGAGTHLPFVYDLPLEQLCGQLSVAAETLLEEPSRSPDLTLCLIGVEGEADLLTITGRSRNVLESPSEESTRVAQARGTLARLVQRRIDGFQIAAGAVWRRRLRGFVMEVSVVLAWVIAFTTHREAWGLIEVLRLGLYGTLAGILAAFLAMLFRDLTAIVESRRRAT